MYNELKIVSNADLLQNHQD